jgi:hypothetical protein
LGNNKRNEENFLIVVSCGLKVFHGDPNKEEIWATTPKHKQKLLMIASGFLPNSFIADKE